MNTYERAVRLLRGRVRRSMKGRIVVSKAERPLERTRQGRLRFYLHDAAIHDTALKDWRVFVHEIPERTGRHTHQGGLALFVLEGKGWTVLEGKRVDWKAGDLILLPIRPGGVEHQHFNADPKKPARWLALVYSPHMDAIAHFIEQKEDAPR